MAILAHYTLYIAIALHTLRYPLTGRPPFPTVTGTIYQMVVQALIDIRNLSELLSTETDLQVYENPNPNPI